jgi:stage V sporulation protein R
VREDFCDFTFVHTFVDQDFVDRYRLFVTEKRLNRDRMVWEYVVTSRSGEEYRRMIEASLYHPPKIDIDTNRASGGSLYLVHRFEGLPLVREYIANTMLGIAYLWGKPVQLETSEPAPSSPGPSPLPGTDPEAAKPAEIRWERVRYTMKDRKLTREVLSASDKAERQKETG